MTKATATIPSVKVALVYDRVNTPHGGAEQVLLALHEIYPDAPLFTAVFDATQAPWSIVFPQIIPSFLQRIPWFRDHHRALAALMPVAFESFDFSEFDVVISITSAEAKGVITKPNQLHICYLLTPTRYLYSHYHRYRRDHPFLKWPIISNLDGLATNYLKRWDLVAANRPDYIIPISQSVSDRVSKYYHRECLPVLYPPATDLPEDVLPPTHLPTENWLVVSRMVSYKRIDLAIKACLQLRQPLTIVGEGPQLKKWQELAGDSPLITWAGALNTEQVFSLMRRSRGVIMPGEEDFGVTGLEALECGTPVVVHAHSGVAEIVRPGIDGTHITDETVSAVVDAMVECSNITFDRERLQERAKAYTKQAFKERFWSQYQTLLRKEKHVSS
jgi:glycosyltransferase involved in cell wall biosynthesis